MDFRDAFNKGCAKIERMQSKLTAFPHTTNDGKWLTHENAHWTGGFWIGMWWLKYLKKKIDNDKQIALEWARKLKVRINDNKTHDMGFIFGPSCILGYNITGKENLLKMAERGVNNLLDLYQKDVGLVLAWDEPGYEGVSIVDTIMNIPLIAFMGQKKNNNELLELSKYMANTIKEQHVRDDFSTYHVVKWDPDTHRILERTTHQGFAPTSCWSRGQAWALYGFSNMYRYTGEMHYLEVSMNLADYFWQHLDSNYLPKWDFVFKDNDNEPFDASAASIAASGMLLLSHLLLETGQQDKADIWQSRGERLVRSLIENCLYTDIDKYGIIEKATVDKPRNSAIGESTMYGDYYFMEAVFRLLNKPKDTKLDFLY